MRLEELLAPVESRVGVVERRGDLTVPLTRVTDDSRRVEPGSLFVAVKGGQVDGHDFIPAALGAGASAVVVQRDWASLGEAARRALDRGSAALVRVTDSRRALGWLASRFYGDPAGRLRMIGVTGTNGKTTVTYLCKALLEAGGRRVGLLGTVAYLIGSERLSAPHTTPEAVEFQRLLARMVDAGADTAVMEVSSHALALDRTAGCEFDVAVFTNLTQDHLDFHADMEDYFQAKLKLFAGLGDNRPERGRARAIINVDDPYGSRVQAAYRGAVWTYSLSGTSDLRAERVELGLDGTRFLAVTPQGRFEIASRLVGEHNVANLLAAVGVALNEGLSPDAIQAGIRAAVTVPGRFERVEGGQAFTVVVDYAHTEDALRRLLSAAEKLRTGRIITVFGCGGDRDRGKRPKMGRVAAVKSDVVYLTSDNPRTEDPLAILKEVEAGVQEALRGRETAPGFRYEVIADRRHAIEAAVRDAKAGDMVVIAGKGHEDYQIVGRERHHFDDREVARAAIGKVSA